MQVESYNVYPFQINFFHLVIGICFLHVVSGSASWLEILLVKLCFDWWINWGDFNRLAMVKGFHLFINDLKAIIYFDICSNLEAKRWDIKDK